MWLIEGRSALEVTNTHTTNSDQLVITIADGRPPGGRELVGSDLTISRIGVIPPILTAKHCAVNSASAIEATVRGFIDIVVGFCRAKRTGSTHFLFVGGHGQRRCGGGSMLVLMFYGGGNIIWWPQVHAAFVGIIILPVIPAHPSIDNMRVHHTMVNG